MPRRHFQSGLLAALSFAGVTHAETPHHAVETLAEKAVATRGARDLVVVPIPSLSPALGAGVAPAALLLYRPAGSPEPWTTGVVGLYTSNGSKALGGLHKMSLDNDRFRLTAAGGYGAFNLRFYGVGSTAGRTPSIAIRQDGVVGLIDATVRARPNLHIGLRARYLDLKTELRATSRPRGLDIPRRDLNSRVVAIGPAFEYDTRDTPFSPRSGERIAGRWVFDSKGLGGDYGHSRMTLEANLYRPVDDKTVIAARAAVCRASAAAPFFEVCQFGQSNDLRGYGSGEYSDLAFWAAQVELRHGLNRRFGAVIFAGVGAVGPDLRQLPGATLLPAAGLGLRYKVSPEYGLNLAVDAAVGRDSRALYVSVGEAF